MDVHSAPPAAGAGAYLPILTIVVRKKGSCKPSPPKGQSAGSVCRTGYIWLRWLFQGTCLPVKLAVQALATAALLQLVADGASLIPDKHDRQPGKRDGFETAMELEDQFCDCLA